jgi:hypothetical protein
VTFLNANLSTRRRTISVLAALLNLGVAVACGGGDGGTEPAPTPVPTTIEVSAPTISLRMGETRQLTATVLDQQNRPMTNQGVSWSSSDTTKVVVENSGLARGVRPGSATITATSGALSANVSGTVAAPAPVIESGAAVTATIGSNGGEISAQAADGTRYSLAIPPLALEGNTSITVTPITTIDNLPAGSTFRAAVRMQPDGLAFLTPATLTMDLTAAPPAGALFGLRFGDNGSPLVLAPIAASGKQLTMSVSHFSGAGAANLTCPPLIGLSSTARDLALHNLAIEECKAQQTGSLNSSAIINILQTWYTTSIKPALSATPTGTALTSAFGEWAEWRELILIDYYTAIGAVSSLTATFSEGQSLAAAALKAEVGVLNQRCITNEDLASAAKVFFWQQKANGTGLATVANGLDLATIKNGLCVKLDVQQTQFPSSVQQGTAATLLVKAGVRFGSGGVVYTKPLQVTVAATGATPASSNKTTDQSGTATFDLTPTAAGSAVHLAVRVALVTEALDTYGLSKDESIDRQTANFGITITPTAAILNPGAQATFTATITGAGNTGVTWTFTGGTVAGSGTTVTYTAGQASGQFSITARSLADPTKTATATIHVVAPASGISIERLQRSVRAEMQFATNGTHVPGCSDPKFLEGIVPPMLMTAVATCGATGGSSRTGTATSTLSTAISGGSGSSANMSVSFAGSNDVTASSNPIDTHLSHTNATALSPTLATVTFDVLSGAVPYSVTGTASGTGAAASRQECARVQVQLLGPGVDRREDTGVVCSGATPPVKPPLNLNWTGSLAPGRYTFFVYSEAIAYAGRTFDFGTPTKSPATARTQYSILLTTGP